MHRHLLLFFLFNLAVAALGVLFLIYAHFAIGGKLPNYCFFKVLTGLYCPACGGTRAVTALWHFDFPGALRYNAYVVLFAFFALFYEIYVLVRILKRHPRPFWIPSWAGWGLLVLWGVFFVLRNVLLLCGIDIPGDFLFAAPLS